MSHIISLNPATRSLSITGHWNVSLPSGESPWNSIFGPGRRSKYNTLTHNPFVTLSQPFRIKYIFLKKCVRSSLLCLLCFRMYMCIVVYVLRLCHNKTVYILNRASTLWKGMHPTLLLLLISK